MLYRQQSKQSTSSNNNNNHYYHQNCQNKTDDDMLYTYNLQSSNFFNHRLSSKSSDFTDILNQKEQLEQKSLKNANLVDFFRFKHKSQISVVTEATKTLDLSYDFSYNKTRLLTSLKTNTPNEMSNENNAASFWKFHANSATVHTCGNFILKSEINKGKPSINLANDFCNNRRQNDNLVLKYYGSGHNWLLRQKSTTNNSEKYMRNIVNIDSRSEDEDEEGDYNNEGFICWGNKKTKTMKLNFSGKQKAISPIIGSEDNNPKTINWKHFNMNSNSVSPWTENKNSNNVFISTDSNNTFNLNYIKSQTKDFNKRDELLNSPEIINVIDNKKVPNSGNPTITINECERDDNTTIQQVSPIRSTTNNVSIKDVSNTLNISEFVSNNNVSTNSYSSIKTLNDNKNVFQSSVMGLSPKSPIYNKTAISLVNNNYPFYQEIISQANKLILDQSGCRFLQKKIDEDKWLSNPLFEVLRTSIITMCTDCFGNYLIQKLWENISDINIKEFVEIISDQFIYISTSVFGTRVIQKALELWTDKFRIHSDNEISLHSFNIWNSLIIDNIVSWSGDSNSSHILIKYSRIVKSPYNEGLYKAIYQCFMDLCLSKHGCCVVQKSIEYGNEEQKTKWYDLSINNASYLIRDQFGNYVIQYIVCINDQSINNSIVNVILKDLPVLCKEKYGSNVIEKFISNNNNESKKIIEIIVNNVHIIHELLINQFGNYIIQKILAWTTGEEHWRVLKWIANYHQEILQWPFGSRLLMKLKERYQDFNYMLEEKFPNNILNNNNISNNSNNNNNNNCNGINTNNNNMNYNLGLQNYMRTNRVEGKSIPNIISNNTMHFGRGGNNYTPQQCEINNNNNFLRNNNAHDNKIMNTNNIRNEAFIQYNNNNNNKNNFIYHQPSQQQLSMNTLYTQQPTPPEINAQSKMLNYNKNSNPNMYNNPYLAQLQYNMMIYGNNRNINDMGMHNNNQYKDNF